VLVLGKIPEHVDERVPHLARGRERTGVIPVRPHAAGARERAVHRFREPDGEALHPPRERRVIVSFAEEMQVIPLDGELRDAEPAA
jgi:hypothetical protein